MPQKKAQKKPLIASKRPKIDPMVLIKAQDNTNMAQ